MKSKKGKSRRVISRSPAAGNGMRFSFRGLKAFGMWRNRQDLKDPIRFTYEIRARLEQPIDAR